MVECIFGYWTFSAVGMKLKVDDKIVEARIITTAELNNTSSCEINDKNDTVMSKFAGRNCKDDTVKKVF